ncbi:MAG TPA: hypothetical protein VF982_02635 [Anaerolineales bacterium]
MIPMQMLTERFHTAMLDLADKAAGIDSLAEIFKKRIQNDGGVETAKRLVRDRGPQPGLIQLWEAERLDISVEALMLNTKYQSLFSEEELAEARRRLESLGYDV